MYSMLCWKWWSECNIFSPSVMRRMTAEPAGWGKVNCTFQRHVDLLHILKVILSCWEPLQYLKKYVFSLSHRSKPLWPRTFLFSILYLKCILLININAEVLQNYKPTPSSIFCLSGSDPWTRSPSHNLVMKHIPGADPELVLLNHHYEELDVSVLFYTCYLSHGGR